jgi:hypothetical protein
MKSINPLLVTMSAYISRVKHRSLNYSCINFISLVRSPQTVAGLHLVAFATLMLGYSSMEVHFTLENGLVL